MLESCRRIRCVSRLSLVLAEALMAISYSCPHCGKQFSVAEQYAGQTGPCAACGKPITIPGAAPGYAYKPQPSGGSGGLAVVAIVLVVLVVFCGGGVLALLLPAVQAARE